MCGAVVMMDMGTTTSSTSPRRHGRILIHTALEVLPSPQMLYKSLASASHSAPPRRDKLIPSLFLHLSVRARLKNLWNRQSHGTRNLTLGALDAWHRVMYTIT